MNSEENKDLEIVMGGDSDLEISAVGDIMNDLKPNTSKDKKPIIIPVSKNKSQNTETKNDSKETEDTTDDDVKQLEEDAFDDIEEDENNDENEE